MKPLVRPFVLVGALMAAGHGHASAQAGTLEGTVTLPGDSFPGPTTVLNSTDPEVCGREHDLRDMVVSRENHGLQDVIVSIIDVPDERLPDPAPGRLVIDNRDCQFFPHVAVASVGDTVTARNSDPTLHNTHFYGPMRSNVALTTAGMSASRIATRAGLVTVLCDVHGWMKAFLRIDPHPFHDVTDARGRFMIDRIPPGSYTLELWHERLGTRKVEVQVEADSVTTVTVEF